MNHGRAKTKPQSKPRGGSEEFGYALPLVGSTARSRKDYEAYREMRCDPTIAIARAAATAPVKFASYSVEGENPEIVGEVRSFLDSQWQEIVRLLLFAVDYGWVPAEKVWYVDPRTGQQHVRLKPLRQEETEAMVDRETGELMGLKQKDVYLDMRHALVFTLDGEYGSPYGRSRYENFRRTAWEPWKKVVSQLERYHEKASGVVPVVRYPVGVSRSKGGMEVDNFQHASNLVNSLSRMRGVAIPWKIEEWMTAALRQGANLKDLAAWQLEFLDVKSGAGAEMVASARYYDSLKARGMLVPERAVLEGQFGTKAEAGEHADVAVAVSEELFQDVCSCVNTQLVDDFVEVNFGPDAVGSARVEPAPMRDDEKAFAKEIVRAVLESPGNSDMVQSMLDFDAMIEATGLPRREGGEVLPSAWEPAKKVDVLGQIMAIKRRML